MQNLDLYTNFFTPSYFIHACTIIVYSQKQTESFLMSARNFEENTWVGNRTVSC